MKVPQMLLCGCFLLLTLTVLEVNAEYSPVKTTEWGASNPVKTTEWGPKTTEWGPKTTEWGANNPVKTTEWGPKTIEWGPKTTEWGAHSNGHTLKLMCDDYSTIYYDGVEQKNVAGTGAWNTLATSTIPASTKEVMVKCRNGGGPNGIKAQILDASGKVVSETGKSWQCSNQMNSGYKAAFVEPNKESWKGQLGSAAIIWSGTGQDGTAYCKFELGGSGSTNAHLWLTLDGKKFSWDKYGRKVYDWILGGKKGGSINLDGKDYSWDKYGVMFYNWLDYWKTHGGSKFSWIKLGSWTDYSALPGWKKEHNMYLSGYATPGQIAYTTLLQAQRACSSRKGCGGITLESEGYTLRKGTTFKKSPSQETSWLRPHHHEGSRHYWLTLDGKKLSWDKWGKKVYDWILGGKKGGSINLDGKDYSWDKYGSMFYRWITYVKTHGGSKFSWIKLGSWKDYAGNSQGHHHKWTGWKSTWRVKTSWKVHSHHGDEE